jgi:hypothetical protein
MKKTLLNIQQSSPLASLPPELIQGIGEFLSFEDANNLSSTCKCLALALNPLFFKRKKIDLDKRPEAVIRAVYATLVKYYKKNNMIYNLFHKTDRNHAIKLCCALQPANKQLSDEFKILTIYTVLNMRSDPAHATRKALSEQYGKKVIQDITNYIYAKYIAEKIPDLLNELNNHICKNPLYNISDTLIHLVNNSLKSPSTTPRRIYHEQS